MRLIFAIAKGKTKGRLLSHPNIHTHGCEDPVALGLGLGPVLTTLNENDRADSSPGPDEASAGISCCGDIASHHIVQLAGLGGRELRIMVPILHGSSFPCLSILRVMPCEVG